MIKAEEDDEDAPKPYAKMEFVFENKQMQTTLREVMVQMGASIKNGSAPCAKPIRKVKALMKALRSG